MPKNVARSIIDHLSQKQDEDVVLKKSSAISGGCINEASMIHTSIGLFFVKWNSASLYPGMFEAEAKGLQLLRRTGYVYVPEVIATGEANNTSWLLLELIRPGKQINGFYTDFGKSLAKMHKKSSDYFGLSYDNYIGSLPQSNQKRENWIDFFIEERLEKQIKMAFSNGKIGQDTINRFNNLYKYLHDFFPEEPPALLHGDLWSGNYMLSEEGKACIIDPAVYYGHRLMDIGMSKLFGGFTNEFYSSYFEEYPIGINWENSIDIANLYPLMVHVNLFGGGYKGSVDNVLRKF